MVNKKEIRAGTTILLREKEQLPVGHWIETTTNSTPSGYTEWLLLDVTLKK